jgi:uncharacterized membrane protein
MEARTKERNPVISGYTRLARLGSAVRSLTLASATLSTGLVAGVFYAYTVSVDPALAEQPDASYVATMNAINDKIQNPLFFASFFGALLFPLAALAAHHRRSRPGRFWLIALASALYVGGGCVPRSPPWRSWSSSAPACCGRTVVGG